MATDPGQLAGPANRIEMITMVRIGAMSEVVRNSRTQTTAQGAGLVFHRNHGGLATGAAVQPLRRVLFGRAQVRDRAFQGKADGRWRLDQWRILLFEAQLIGYADSGHKTSEAKPMQWLAQVG